MMDENVAYPLRYVRLQIFQIFQHTVSFKLIEEGIQWYLDRFYDFYKTSYR